MKLIIKKNIEKLKCGCGQEFERPANYRKYNDEHPNSFYKWKLEYCDECFKGKIDRSLKRLPEVLSIIHNALE